MTSKIPDLLAIDRRDLDGLVERMNDSDAGEWVFYRLQDENVFPLLQRFRGLAEEIVNEEGELLQVVTLQNVISVLLGNEAELNHTPEAIADDFITRIWGADATIPGHPYYTHYSYLRKRIAYAMRSNDDR